MHNRGWLTHSDLTYPWWLHPQVRLAVFAEDQTPGSQTVRSRVGPNGWLGDSVSDTVNDPTIDLTSPARIVMGQTHKVGISFGDVLSSTIDSAAGFTFISAFEGAEDVGGFYGLSFFTKLQAIHTMTVSTGEFGGNELIPSLRFNVKLNGTSDFSNYFSVGKQLPGYAPGNLPPGNYLTAFDYDGSKPHGSRPGLWWMGDKLDLSGEFDITTVGPDNPIISTGGLLKFAGNNGGSPPPQEFGSNVPPESVHVFALTEGVMLPQWHRNLAFYLQDKGWLPLP